MFHYLAGLGKGTHELPKVSRDYAAMVSNLVRMMQGANGPVRWAMLNGLTLTVYDDWDWCWILDDKRVNPPAIDLAVYLMDAGHEPFEPYFNSSHALTARAMLYAQGYTVRQVDGEYRILSKSDTPESITAYLHKRIEPLQPGESFTMDVHVNKVGYVRVKVSQIGQQIGKRLSCKAGIGTITVTYRSDSPFDTLDKEFEKLIDKGHLFSDIVKHLEERFAPGWD